MSHIIDGKILSSEVEEEIREHVVRLLKEGKRAPGLAVVLVGENPASKTYVKNKERFAKRCQYHAVQHTLAADASPAELESIIQTLNDDPLIDGILLQLPLPKHLNAEQFIELIDPSKDTDCLTSRNQGKLLQGTYIIAPCTPQGVMRMLKNIFPENNGDLAGKHAVVVGRSILVGKPQALLLLEKNATVTICHSKTKDLPKMVSEADIVVAACGVPQMIRGEWIGEGAVVIDVGINRLPSGKLCGDVEYETALPRSSAISPVPGGVGPMTVAMLIANTMKLYQARMG